MEYKDITTIKADPKQPRKIFDEKHIKGLARSLEQEGIINPIEIDEDGMIITGECRFRAATLLGWKKVPVNINKGEYNPYERLRRQMAENVHQSGADKDSMMNPIDTAKGYEKLLQLRSRHEVHQGKDSGISALAREIGIDESTIRGYLHLLDEPEMIQVGIQQGSIPHTYIREISGAPEDSKETIKKKIVEGEYVSRDQLRQDVLLLRQLPSLGDAILERNRSKESYHVNKILTTIAQLALALDKKPLNEINIQEKGFIQKQLDWLQRQIDQYLDEKNTNKL